MSEHFKEKLKNLISPEGYSDRMRLPPGCGGPCQIVITGNQMVSLDGCRGLLDYAADHISLTLCDGIVTIYGNDLTMKTFCADHIAICGKITGIWEGPFRKEVALAHH